MDTIICERRTYKNILTTHCHGYSQLLLPLSGILDIETDNKKLELDQDEMCLNNYKTHSDIGLTDVCGKCLVGLPCSTLNPLSNI